MSSLDKLGIQGIRSFGPEEMARIEFFSPLTLILGQNGCGKTTIIESLKFVTTGEVPPGCGRGASFIHDPKMAKESVVRAQVKLRFNSTKNELVTGCRSVEVTQKPKKIEFASLESTLEYNKGDGKKRISSKCIDYHAEMTSLLGVVKPILENVIFCHQEESNWPLEEGKKVKEKFDAIFNATKYIKCLDAIRKLHKDKKLEVLNFKKILKDLTGMKDQAGRFRKELENKEKEAKTQEEQIEKLTREQLPVRKRRKEIEKVMSNIESINNDIKRKEYQLTSIKERQNELRSSQSESYICSDAELLIMISDFERNLHMQEENRKELNVRMRRVKENVSATKEKESKALLHLGNLENAQKTQLDNIKKRNELLSDLVHKYNISDFYDRHDFEMSESEDILDHFDQLIQEEGEKIKQKKREFESQEADLQREIDNLRSKEVGLEHDIMSLSNQIEGNRKESRVLRQKLMKNEDDLGSINLEELKQSLEEITKNIEKEEKRVDVTKLQREIESQKDSKAKIERELETVKEKLHKMTKQAEERLTYEMHMKQKRNLEQQNQQLIRRNDDDFAIIFHGSVTDNIKNVFDAQQTKIRKRVEEEEEKKGKLEIKKTELMTQIDNEKRTIGKLEGEIKGFESKLEDICGRKDLEEAILKSKDEIDNLHKVIGDQESSLVLFRGFMEKIQGGEPCPLCHRDFEDGYEEMLVEELERKLRRLPGELSKRQRELKNKDELHNKLVQLQPQKVAADKSSKELESHRLKLKGFYNEHEKVCEQLETFSDDFALLLSEKETCDRVQADILAIDQNFRNIRQLSEKISTIQATLGAADNDLSMEELRTQQKNLELKVKKSQHQIETTWQEINDHKSHVQRLNTKKLELSTKEFELKQKQQETEKLKEDLEKLKEEISKMEDKKEVCKMEIAPIQVQLREKRDSKTNLMRNKEKVIDSDNKKIEKLRDERRGIYDIHRATLAYVNAGRDALLAEGKQKLQNLREEIMVKEADLKDLTEKINRVDKELTTQKERKRNLNDEKTIRDKEIEARRLEDSISLLKVNIKDYEPEKIHDEHRSLCKLETSNTMEQEQLRGKLAASKERLQELHNDLNRKDIRDAEKNYKDKIIDIKCTEIACDDLNKYFKALETAIMRFHRDRMNTINQIIRELWRSTYRGNDIDYIEIKTDESESQGAERRRTYHYRVVMVKNEVEMDMRGRCSAGQKVLASLIIRMALADTFSANCGILALDEPTTNLDRDNIEALSQALLNIVNKRSYQKNFQLIVITHDSEFLERLKRADYIEYYYEVSRNERGLSVIKQHATH